MPIYEQSYRRWQARAPLRSLRAWPITREALRLLLSKRAFLGALVLAWLPFLGFAIYVWGVTRFGDVARYLPTDGRLFDRFFEFQTPLALLLTTFGGAGLVANDLRTGAILVYLSRPLTRRDYVLGKLSVLLALNLSVTLAPGLLLYLVGLGLAPAQFLKWELWFLAPAVAGRALVLSAFLSVTALAVSSLSRSARVAGLAFFGAFVGLDVVDGILGLLVRSPFTVLVSPVEDLRLVGRALLAASQPGTVHPLFAAGVLAAAAAAGLLVLRRRVRAVEVVT